MTTTSTLSRLSAWWPFALLCLLGATRGWLTGALPTSTTTLLSASTGCAAAALVLLLTSRISHLASHASEPRTILAGTLLLAGPLAALLLTGHGIDPNALTLALALVPIVATIAHGALSNTPPGSFAARTWPALAALTGLLLLVPQPSFANPITDAVLIVAPLATGIGAALFATNTQSQQGFTPILFAAALVFALAWFVQGLLHTAGVQFSSLAALLDAATALLTLVALSRIGLTRWTAQFALVPLAVVLQGFILLRPAFDAYSAAGTGLILLGSVFMLLPQPAEKAY